MQLVPWGDHGQRSGRACPGGSVTLEFLGDPKGRTDLTLDRHSWMWSRSPAVRGLRSMLWAPGVGRSRRLELAEYPSSVPAAL